MKPTILYSVKTKDGEFEANVFQNNKGFAVEMRDNEANERIGDRLKIFDSLEKAKKYADDLLRYEDLEEHRAMHRIEKDAAEYQGREVPLNKPMKGDTKKYKVYVKDKDKVKKVEFGDPNMEIKRDSPERRKNFRKRHKCDSDPNAKDKTTPKYWSCRFWEGGTTVTELLNKKSFLSDLRKIEASLEKIAGAIGSDSEFNYAVKIDGVASDYYSAPFGRQIDDLKKVKEFQQKAKKNWIGAKGKATLSAVKTWIKENKPKQFFAKWKKDSSFYQDDSVEIFYL